MNRKCWYRNKKDAKWTPGTLLEFSTDYEELRDGVGQYPVAIIEDDQTHSLEVVHPSNVTFSATP